MNSIFVVECRSKGRRYKPTGFVYQSKAEANTTMQAYLAVTKTAVYRIREYRAANKLPRKSLGTGNQAPLGA